MTTGKYEWILGAALEMPDYRGTVELHEWTNELTSYWTIDPSLGHPDRGVISSRIAVRFQVNTKETEVYLVHEDLGIVPDPITMTYWGAQWQDDVFTMTKRTLENLGYRWDAANEEHYRRIAHGLRSPDMKLRRVLKAIGELQDLLQDVIGYYDHLPPTDPTQRSKPD